MVLLQTAAGVRELLSAGVGLTVTVRFCVFGHPLAVDVIAYTTFTGEAVVLINVSLILPFPLPAVLLIPVTLALVHVNIVPAVALAGA